MAKCISWSEYGYFFRLHILKSTIMDLIVMVLWGDKYVVRHYSSLVKLVSLIKGNLRKPSHLLQCEGTGRSKQSETVKNLAILVH